jgi:sugar phosphate permease
MATATITFSQITPAQRKTLIAAALGWLLDAFDVMLYALVIAYVMEDLAISKATAGLLSTLTLLASGIGGVLFGFLADRVGRVKALMLSIRISLRARTGYGRRMEHRRNIGRGNLAHRVAR